MKTIVVLSGGMDSTTVLYHHKKIDKEVVAISFNYKQRHKKELDYAKKTCEKLGVEHHIIDIKSINEFIGGSSLTSDIEVPKGHYEDETMKATVVPNRNMIMASIAIGYAVARNFNQVALGVHSGDHAIYPDCRPEFIEALKTIAKIANYEPIEISTPYLFADKTEIIKQGEELGADYSLTWTCYEGKEKACGKCGSCQERLEAFKNNNLIDPIQYEN